MSRSTGRPSLDDGRGSARSFDQSRNVLPLGERRPDSEHRVPQWKRSPSVLQAATEVEDLKRCTSTDRCAAIADAAWVALMADTFSETEAQLGDGADYRQRHCTGDRCASVPACPRLSVPCSPKGPARLSQDIVLPKHRTAVLVHGCFWHGHTCKDGRRPRSNGAYWNAKLARNAKRDARNSHRLACTGLEADFVWGCQAQDERRLERRVLVASESR